MSNNEHRFFNILGPSDYTVTATKCPELFKYTITVHNTDTGVETSYLSRGERTGVAAASARYGLYAFSSYHSGGYLNPIAHSDISNQGWDPSVVRSLWYVIRRGEEIQIAVSLNPLYLGQYYIA